jgi:glycogen synthase
MATKLVFVTYETRFARCGGITAVMNYLPLNLRTSAGLSVTVVTPYHHKIPDTFRLPTRTVGQLLVSFYNLPVPVEIRRFDDGLEWYFVAAHDFTLPEAHRIGKTDEQFFSGVKHPYDVGVGGTEQLSILRRDSLLFGAAVAHVLRDLWARTDWTLLLQDWQAAATALALANTRGPNDIRAFLTLHNSYDSGKVTSDELLGFGINPENIPAATPLKESILGRAIPLIQKPIFTVSEQFARDFTEDALQSSVLANHLQDELHISNILGINNGPFASLAIPERPALQQAERPEKGHEADRYSAIIAWKSQRRSAAIEAFEKFEPTIDRPLWGNKLAFLEKAKSDPAPIWFALAGRDDTRQKGYDVAAFAIENFLSRNENKVRAQFLFFPIPGDEDREGLAFLKALADKYQDNVIILPFIFQEGYIQALQGSAYGIMPSLYEPFGMANEFYLHGAVGIGRATGGLIQQIVPMRSIPSFTPDVDRLARNWHPPSAAGTGLLYREPDDPKEVADWRAINTAAYLLDTSQSRVDERKEYTLFKNMAAKLEQAVDDAIRIYHSPPDASNGIQPYYQMIVSGIRHIQRCFSWERSAAEYRSYIAQSW